MPYQKKYLPLLIGVAIAAGIFVGGNLNFSDSPDRLFSTNSKKDKLFEFLVNDTQQFNLYTDTVNYVLNMKVNGSPENKLFFDYVKHNSNLRMKEQVLLHEQKSYPPVFIGKYWLRAQDSNLG